MSDPQLRIRLGAAAVQGAALYALHVAIVNVGWPATDVAWLLAMYTVTICVPLTLHLLVEQAFRTRAWLYAAALGVAFGYLAWNAGAQLPAPPPPPNASAVPRSVLNLEYVGPIALTLAVLWLMVLPFLQVRLIHGSWLSDYRNLFAIAWRNKIMLAEAALFTIVLWLLLVLWAGLFMTLGLPFFGNLFIKAGFVYPVTAVSFALALHLVHSVDRFVTAVLDQVLGLLKWLALLVGLILALFTLALVARFLMPAISGHHAINSWWLLWLIALTVLLMNAAYRDGRLQAPFAPRLSLALRCVVPLMVIVSLTALDSLFVRSEAYGLTVLRTWGFIVAGAALAYSCGYTYAALRPGPWMGKMGQVNVCVALGLIAVIALTQTPALSPLRLSAASQRQRILDNTGDVEAAYRYLRFHAGRYGSSALDELANLRDHPRSDEIRAAVARWRAVGAAGQAPLRSSAAEQLAKLEVFPGGRTLDPDLQAFLSGNPSAKYLFERGGCSGDGIANCFGLYVDLDGDGREEFVVLSPSQTNVYVKTDVQWQFGVGARGIGKGDRIKAALSAGDFGPQAHRWRSLRIGRTVISVFGQP